LVSAWGLTRGTKYVQRAGVFVVTLATLIVYVPDIDLRWPSAQPRVADIPAIGRYLLTDGRGHLQEYEAYGIWLGEGGDWYAGLRPEPIDAATTREWQKIIAQTVAFVRRENQSSTPVTFGFRHILYNMNSVQLAQLLQYDHEMPTPAPAVRDRRGGGPNFLWIDQESLGKSEDAYFEWLRNGNQSCLLLTSAGIIDEFPPIRDSDALTSAARRAGFLSFARWKLPDGRDVVAWRRDSDLCRKK
jgi:hypothetical protein